MKKFACIICGRDKQGAVICKPYRQANIRMLESGKLTTKEIFIVMMYPKILRKNYELFKLKKSEEFNKNEINCGNRSSR